MSRIILNVEQAHRAGTTVRALHIQSVRTRHTVRFKFADESLPDPGVLDGFVAGILFYAMRSAKALQVRGPVSRRLLRSLPEFQSAWRQWRPKRYTVIDVLPDSIVEDDRFVRRNSALSAFSGGIDSTFSLWRHQHPTGAAQCELQNALLVQGFDVRLNNPADFQSLVQRSSPLLNRLGIRLRTMSTNLREENLQDWEDSFGGQIACCLHQYSHEFGYGLIGSGDPYRSLYLPCGSNPVTDPLLSGGGMEVVHYGADFSRTEKLESLLKAGLPLQGLRVCWEGRRQDRNCGRCEKCVRTLLCFLAAGIPDPPCFDARLRIKDVENLLIGNPVQYGQLRSVYDHLVERGFESEIWTIAVKARLDRYRPPSAAGSILLAIQRRTRRLLSSH